MMTVTADSESALTVRVETIDIDPDPYAGADDLGRAIALLNRYTNIAITEARIYDDDGADAISIDGVITTPRQ